jgi:lysophospholipase L1-like esterase
MTTHFRFALLIAISLLSTEYLAGHAFAQNAAVVEAPPKKNAAVDPAPRPGNWMQRHERINERAKQGDVDLLFIGDSITDGWQNAGKDVWAKYYGNRKAMNAGIGGDRTQHVLWRLDNGNIDGIKPKLAVLMIGTNNSNRDDNTADEIGDGIKAIVARLREKLPDTKVLVLSIFPRGATTDAQLERIVTQNGKKEVKEVDMPKLVNEARENTKKQRKKNSDASAIAAKLADNKMVFVLDINDKFLKPDGELPRDIMPDYLHPNTKGYEIWAEAIEPKVAELLGEKK